MKFRGTIKFRDTMHCYEWVKPLSSGWIDDEFEERKWPALKEAYAAAKRDEGRRPLRGEDQRGA
jgi:hypothetical protein